jgi:hypothetical protein
MTYTDNTSWKSKISTVFSSRLARLEPENAVRALVLLRTQNSGRVRSRRRNRTSRQEIVDATQKSAERALDDIDRILESFGGERLSKTPDALGSIAVETTVAGIEALAASAWVKAIFEDQDVHPVP